MYTFYCDNLWKSIIMTEKFRKFFLLPCKCDQIWECLLFNRLYSSCVRSSMLHGSETWPVRKENEVALQRAEVRMVRWMCNVKVKDRVDK